MKEIITDVRESELKAKKIIENAEKKRSEIVLEAKQHSMKHLNEGKAVIDRENDGLIKKKSAELEELKSKIIKAGEEGLKKIEERAKKNMQRTEEFVLKKFEENVLK